MRLDLTVGFLGFSAENDVPYAQHAERLGYESLWTAESTGPDAASVATWLAAHTSSIRIGTSVLQMYARTPTLAAMTAASIARLSGDRFTLGLGPSTSVLRECWHGVAVRDPLARIREYVDIVRLLLESDEPLSYRGRFYNVPAIGAEAAKSFRLRSRPRDAFVPIYLTGIGPRGVELAAEIADGWIPAFYSPERAVSLYRDALVRGLARRNVAARGALEIAPIVPVIMGPDTQACIDHAKPWLANYLGMTGPNPYVGLLEEYGFGAEAHAVRAAYVAGRKAEAIAGVPGAFLDEVSLLGPPERIAERITRWRATPVTKLIVGVQQADALEHLAKLAF